MTDREQSSFVKRVLTRMKDESGATLVLVLIFLVLLSLLGMSLLFTTDVELRSSDAYMERTQALNDTDSALNELIWRLNSSPGTLVNVNKLTNYDASIDFDPDDIMANGTDDDGDGATDEPDEMNLARDWEVRMALLPDLPPSVKGYVVSDGSISSGPPWGSKSIVSTVQPMDSWRQYATSDITQADALQLRFKLDTDTAIGDSEGDGAEIVFYDPALVVNGVDDPTSIVGLGGDGNANNDSPYNITYFDGTTTYPASGTPVMLATITARIPQANGTVARRTIEAELTRKRRTVIRKAICTCGDLDLGGPLDSYKSSEGYYGAAGVYDNGDIGANGNISLSGGGLVNGNSESGLETKLSGLIMKDAWAGNSIVTLAEVLGTGYENFLPPPQPCDCNAIDLPTVMARAKASNDNANILPNGVNPYVEGTCTVNTTKSIYKNPGELDVGSHMSIIMPGGTYYFTYLKVSEIVQVGIDTDGDCIVDAPPLEPVRIFVEGEVTISAKGIFNASQQPENLQIYMHSATQNFAASGGSLFRGIVYHPGMDCDVSGGAEIEGAFVCGTFKGGGDAFHFDEDLKHQIIADGDVELLAWREVN